jgi:protein-tyrosine phosphatase
MTPESEQPLQTEEHHAHVPQSATSPSPLQPEELFVLEETRPLVHFSFTRWISTGIVRLLYRYWTRIAVVLFPEDSASARLAQQWRIPLPDTLNLSWVTPHLAVGGRVHPDDIHHLARLGVTQVVDTRSEHSDDAEALKQEQIDLLYLPTPDTHPLTLDQLTEGAAWVNDRIKDGGRVLIHCEHGVGRSVLLTSAVLVQDGMHARDALALVQQKRWQAAPNHKQVERLREFEELVRSRSRSKNKA